GQVGGVDESPARLASFCNGHCGVQLMGAPPQRHQRLASGINGIRLRKDLALAGQHLIRSNHDSIAIEATYILGLGPRENFRNVCWINEFIVGHHRLADDVLVDGWTNDREFETGGLEQLSTDGTSGRQNELKSSALVHCSPPLAARLCPRGHEAS